MHVQTFPITSRSSSVDSALSGSNRSAIRGARELNSKMSRVYVGDLSTSAVKGDLEREFERYGRLRDVWVARNPPGFAFIEFEDYRDAEVGWFNGVAVLETTDQFPCANLVQDAVRGLDGKEICGQRIRVEHSRNKVFSVIVCFRLLLFFSCFLRESAT